MEQQSIAQRFIERIDSLGASYRSGREAFIDGCNGGDLFTASIRYFDQVAVLESMLCMSNHFSVETESRHGALVDIDDDTFVRCLSAESNKWNQFLLAGTLWDSRDGSAMARYALRLDATAIARYVRLINDLLNYKQKE